MKIEIDSNELLEQIRKAYQDGFNDGLSHRPLTVMYEKQLSTPSNHEAAPWLANPSTHWDITC